MFPGTNAEISVGHAATPFGQYSVAQALAASSPLWLVKSISAEKHSIQSLMDWLLPKFSAAHLKMLPGSTFSFLLPRCGLLPPLAGVASAVAARERRMKAFMICEREQCTGLSTFLLALPTFYTQILPCLCTLD